MNFEIPAELYVRFSGVVKLMPINVSEDERLTLKCVRYERRAGHVYAIASNRKIAAIQYLGLTNEPDGVAHIIVDDALVKQCKSEIPHNSTLQIVCIPELQAGSAKTKFGYAFPGNACVFPAFTQLDKWSTWVPNKPLQASKKGMLWTLDLMEALNAASPSGRIIFPDVIDVSQPIMVRDKDDENWFGLFMGNCQKDTGEIYECEPTTLATWWPK